MKKTKRLAELISRTLRHLIVERGAQSKWAESWHAFLHEAASQQLDRLQTYCRSQAWPEQDLLTFLDNGYSGASLKRPGLDRLRDAVARADIDLILLTEPSRLARNYVHQMLLLQELQDMGCQVIFLDRPMS